MKLLAFLPAALMLIIAPARTTFADQVQLNFAPSQVRSTGPGNVRIYAEPVNISLGTRVYIDYPEAQLGGIFLADGDADGETFVLWPIDATKLEGDAGRYGFRDWPAFAPLFGTYQLTAAGFCLVVSDQQLGECQSQVQAPPGDFNLDGNVDIQDIFDFIARWSNRDIGADRNSDNLITATDLHWFLAEYFAGI